MAIDSSLAKQAVARNMAMPLQAGSSLAFGFCTTHRGSEGNEDSTEGVAQKSCPFQYLMYH